MGGASEKRKFGRGFVLPSRAFVAPRMSIRRFFPTFLTLLLAGPFVLSSPAFAQQNLLNVSYDPTRELYKDLNAAFVADRHARHLAEPSIQQSHGGSGKQARAVIEGLEADVVTLALGYDIDQIAASGLLDKNWQKALPNNSSPYTSTIVFLVRSGNPKKINDWNDLVRDGIAVITPNPKTSGGARWNYLAAWGYAAKKFGSDEGKVKEFMKKLFGNVPVLDTGARGSTTTFVERGIGDVLIAWENEALFAAESMAKGKVEVIYPSVSILAEPPVAVVDAYAKKHGTTDLAADYLRFLYSEEAQKIVERHYFRPRRSSSGDKFKSLPLFTLEDTFRNWDAAHRAHFADGGSFDQIYEAK